MNDYIDRGAFERRCMFDPDIQDMQDVIYALRDYPAADVIPRSEACPYYVHNEHNRGNDSLCKKARCEVQDVRPVVRGEWIKPTGMMPPEHHGHYECSVCGFWAMRDWVRPWKGVVLTAFCPNCGADMRGKEKE